MDANRAHIKYVLDWDKLESCDIVLSRASWASGVFKDALTSHVIRMGSKDYSHAMLFFDGSILHAHPPIVFATNPQRIWAAQHDDCLCLRCPGLTADQKTRIEEYAREHVGALYSTIEAIQTPLWKTREICASSGKEFCSRFVAEAYASAGISLVHNPSFCAPGDFLQSKNLKQMGPCTRIATDTDVSIVSSTDYVLVSQKRTSGLLKKVRRLAKQDGLEITSFKSVVEYVQQYPSRDAEVAQLFLKTRYFETWKEEADAHKYRYNLPKYSAWASLYPQYAKAEISGLFDCAGRYGDALLFLESIHAPLRTIIQLVDCYRKMLQDIAQRLLMPIGLNMGRPEVGPLVQLRAICEHLVNGTYRQYFSSGVTDEIQQLKFEWQRYSP